MKVGYQIIDDFKLIARRDKNSGVAGKRVQNAVFVAGSFEQAERSGTDGDNAFSGGFGLIDGFGGSRRNDAVFGVHFVIVGVFNLNRQKSSGADVEGEKNFFDALFFKSFKNPRRKVQTCRRGGNGAFVRA